MAIRDAKVKILVTLATGKVHQMKVAVTGATGFIGKALCNELAPKNNVIALTRSLEKAQAILDKAVEIIQWNPNMPGGWEKYLENSDAIVNLAGTNLASGRWTKKLKAKILDSHIKTSKALIQAIKTLKAKPKAIITASAIGFYGNRADEKLDEESGVGDAFWQVSPKRLKTVRGNLRLWD